MINALKNGVVAAILLGTAIIIRAAAGRSVLHIDSLTSKALFAGVCAGLLVSAVATRKRAVLAPGLPASHPGRKRLEQVALFCSAGSLVVVAALVANAVVPAEDYRVVHAVVLPNAEAPYHRSGKTFLRIVDDSDTVAVNTSSRLWWRTSRNDTLYITLRRGILGYDNVHSVRFTDYHDKVEPSHHNHPPYTN